MTRRKAQRSIADKEILTMEEAAEYLSVNRTTLLGLIQEEKIPASKLRFRWRLKKTDIDYYVRHGRNPVAVEQEKERERERTPEAPAKKAPPPKREVLDPEALERLKNSPRSRRTLPTALLLKKAIAVLSENPCYLVGSESQTFLNTHFQDNGLECDLVAKGALGEVLLRAAELLLNEELPPPSHRRQLLTLPAEPRSPEVINEHLNQAIREAGLSREEGSQLKQSADELFTNAMEAGAKEVRVIIEVGKEDVLVTVINAGRVEKLPGRMPGPESLRGRGTEFAKGMADDFLFLSTNDQVIATVRKARRAGKESGGNGR